MSRECKSGEITAFLIGRLTVNPGPAGRTRSKTVAMQFTRAVTVRIVRRLVDSC
eukprot:COSAG05_NODE_1832_length_3998_cov_11.418312_8_plen_53_part_01